MKNPISKILLAVVCGTTCFNALTVQAEDSKVDPESIYARLGRQAAIDAAADRFYVKVLADDRVNYFFENTNMEVQHRRQKEFLSAVLGGPKPWTGKDMRQAHKHLALEEKHFGAISEHLHATLTELKVDEALIGEIMTVVASTKDDVLNCPTKKEK